MTVLVIHCSRQQVIDLVIVFGKIHIKPDGIQILITPEWLLKMYKAAKVNDYRHSYQSGSRMITHPY